MELTGRIVGTLTLGWILGWILYRQHREAIAISMWNKAQMFARGIFRGLPHRWHWGMVYGDPYLAVLLMAIMYWHSDQWSVVTFFTVAVIFLRKSFGATNWFEEGNEHDELSEAAYIIEKHRDPEYDGDNLKNGRTQVGELHTVFMGIALTVLTMFYFFTKNAMPWFVITLSVFLWLHVFLAHHFIPAFYCWWKGETWYPPSRPFSWYLVQTSVVLAIVLGPLAWWMITHPDQSVAEFTWAQLVKLKNWYFTNRT
jgi:hypothetical protein